MVKKIIVCISYITMALVIFMYKDTLISWVGQEQPFDLLLLTSTAILIALVPIIPYGIIGGIIGAKYGVYIGGLINIFSSSVAAIIMFIAIRYLFQQRGRKWLANYKYTEIFTNWMERHPYITILIGRMLPFVPAVVINSYTAISKIKLIYFIAATVIGKIPVMFLFALLGHQLLNNPSHMIVTIIVYSLGLCFIIWRYWYRYKHT